MSVLSFTIHFSCAQLSSFHRLTVTRQGAHCRMVLVHVSVCAAAWLVCAARVCTRANHATRPAPEAQRLPGLTPTGWSAATGVAAAHSWMTPTVTSAAARPSFTPASWKASSRFGTSRDLAYLRPSRLSNGAEYWSQPRSGPRSVVAPSRPTGNCRSGGGPFAGWLARALLGQCMLGLELQRLGAEVRVSGQG